MTKYVPAALAALALTFGALAGFYIHQTSNLRHALAIAEPKAKKFDAHCRFLRVTLERGIADLSKESDPAKQEHLGNELFDDLSSPVAALYDCTSATSDSARLVTCWTTHDYRCIAELAKRTADTLPPP